jgi:small subunit ribosomal protein S6
LGPSSNGLLDPETGESSLHLPEHRSDNETLVELETAFKFNDAVLRHLTVKMKKAETAPSPMMKSVQREDAAKSHRAEAAAAAPAA